MSKIRKAYALLKFWRVYRLEARGSYAEALKALSYIKSDPEDMAKALVFRANLMHKLGRKQEAIHVYSDFIEVKYKDVADEGDREYLLLYSQYYRDIVSRQINGETIFNVTKSEVVNAGVRATDFVRHEFPPPPIAGR